MKQDIKVSLVIPLLNEEESLPELIRRLTAVLDVEAPNSYELLFIDDGSTDSSFAVLSKYQQERNDIHIVQFRRNYGKAAALAVGFERANGEIVITMDADLQDDPAEIPALIAKLNEGYDLVSGWKKTRHDPWHKTMPSKLFNYVTSVASGIRLHDFNCGLKAYRKEVVKSLNVYGEMHRYLPAFAHSQGFKVTEMPVLHHARQFGVSKYGASRLIKGFLDLLTFLLVTRYLKRPLHLFGGAGVAFGTSGFFVLLYLTIQWFLGLTSLSNRPLALFGVLLVIVGVQLISIGLIGEMLVKKQFQDTSQYLIKNERTTQRNT